MPQTPSTRWCPTPEQLMILEEMYRSGVRTPNAAEIQQITAHLAYYGRIEGKNVFYWFQNHKARERQRLRRRLCARHQQQYAQQQQQQPSSTSPNATAALATASGSGSSGGVHPAVLQLHHHHHPYTSSSVHHAFMPQGYFQQDGATLPLPRMDQLNAGKIGECMDPNNTCMAYDQDWAHVVDCSGGTAGSSDDAAIPPCCRPLKTLELFPTKSTGLKDECSSSKSSSCSTSTN